MLPVLDIANHQSFSAEGRIESSVFNLNTKRMGSVAKSKGYDTHALCPSAGVRNGQEVFNNYFNDNPSGQPAIKW